MVVRARLTARQRAFLDNLSSATGLCRSATLRALLDDYMAEIGTRRVDCLEDHEGRWAEDAYEEIPDV